MTLPLALTSRLPVVSEVTARLASCRLPPPNVPALLKVSCPIWVVLPASLDSTRCR